MWDIIIGVWFPLIAGAYWYWSHNKIAITDYNKFDTYEDEEITFDTVYVYCVDQPIIQEPYNPFAIYVITEDCSGKIGSRFFDFKKGDEIDITRYEYEHTPLGQKVEIIL